MMNRWDRKGKDGRMEGGKRGNGEGGKDGGKEGGEDGRGEEGSLYGDKRIWCA